VKNRQAAEAHDRAGGHACQQAFDRSTQQGFGQMVAEI
jgi:hypothetical protein